MNAYSQVRTKGADGLEISWKDDERVFCREQRPDADGKLSNVLTVMPAAEHPTPASLDRLAHEYALKDELRATWAVRPVELIRERGRTVLVLEDPACEPLDRLIGRQMQIGKCLQLAVSLSVAVSELHERGLIHKDIKPANIFADDATGKVRLSGFGIASRLPRERQWPEPPEFIAGTLAYMAPEQTGRMNRSIDSRSDLYALGVTLYEMLTGDLPFTATDPLEWVHCHVARKPTSPSDRLKNIPSAVSAIVMKLLAKTAEARYQTAAGVARDLRRCLGEFETRGRIDDFQLGEHDKPDRLLIPEKLYGRAQEVQTLQMSFDRIVGGSRPELVLVSGYAGIGKSAIVNELRKSLVPSRVLFASGKFDQYKRDIPYATLAQAFQALTRSLLGKSDTELSTWRSAISEAVGPNGRLIVDLVPELKHIIGEQPPVPELPPREAQGRFQLVFRRFIGVFARPEHPLALFLDDLQWLDAATLDLLEEMLTRPDLQHLMLIGAYRDNEVDSDHLLMRKLEAIRRAGAATQDIVLAPLTGEDLGQLVADALQCELERAIPLAQLVHHKTAGNAFFATHFISTLAEEGLLTFDHGEGQWSWDLGRILAKGYTDNVVDLMVGKLNRLPVETRSALQLLSCLGNSAKFAICRMVFQKSDEAMHRQLWDAVRAGFVFRSNDSYKFLHDRVQEAAYSLIPNEERAAVHLRIGRLLAAHTPPQMLEEEVFEIVNQLHRGSRLITTAEERVRVAGLSLIAGRRAKTSTAYGSALEHLTAGRALLTEDDWSDNHELIFSIEVLLAECELLTADMVAAENRLSMLMRRARTAHHVAVATRLRVVLYTTLDRNSRAVEAGLEYLRRGGNGWSTHPTNHDVMHEYNRIWSLVGKRKIEDLIDLPLIRDPDLLDVLDALAELVWPAMFCEEALLSLVICRMVNLSLEHGNSDASCFGYVLFAIIAGPRFGDYEAGLSFGQLGYDLIEDRGLKRFQAGTYCSFGYSALPWTRHVRTGRDLVRRAFHAASEIGDVTSAGISIDLLIRSLLLAGDQLAEVQREAESALHFAQKVRFGRVVDHITPQLGLVRTLRGLTPTFGSLDDDDQFDEFQFELYLANNAAFAEPECWYWIRKLQARVFAGDYASAVAASLSARRRLATSPSQFLSLDPVETAEYHFYSALANAASCDTALPDQRQKHFEALAAHHDRLVSCAENSPENFGNRAALVGAEIARIEGRALDAEQLYEQAIGSAHTNGFIHIEALANEAAARFYAARGLGKIALMYLSNARACYLQWGADGKVRQLDNLYPDLRHGETFSDSTSTISTSVESLDLATVVKLSQAISGEIVLEKLFDRIMRIAVEHAGAERGLLILPRGDEHRIEAEATTTSDSVKVALRQADVTAEDLPESVLRYVVRTKESITLHDAAGESRFSEDEYIRRHQARSVLCLPLLKQTRLVGVLYLENNLSRHVFTAARIAVLTLLASEAAISLENTRLYADLRERESKVRRLVDSNIIGIFIFDHVPDILEANQSFLKTIGYDREDLKAGRVRWIELTPPEWRDRTARARAELKATGVAQPFEKEFFRKDGSRVPVLTGGALFDGEEEQGVAFVLDLSERKRAEVEARESERRYREAQMELAHANRVAVMGQLTASIAHEVSQPNTAVVASAHAARHWLDRGPPDLDKVRQALARIERNAVRASEVIGRIRDLIKKTPPRKDRLAINPVIREVIELTQTEATRNGVSVQTAFAEQLPDIVGDRVELQQVAVNLILNAIEAMSGTMQGDRELLVRTARADNGGVLVAVADSGPGLPPAGLEHLFEPFYTTKAGGLGVGLSICRSIIEAHGGLLWVSANAPRGAIFQFIVPVDGGLRIS